MSFVYSSNEKPVHYNWYQSSSDPRELLENTKKSVDLDSGRTLVVTVYDLRYPVTEDLLNTIFSVYGLIKKIEIVPAEDKFQASLMYKPPSSAKSARSLHGRYIYERRNLLGVEYAEESLNEEFRKYASTEERNRNIMVTLKQMSTTIDTLFSRLNKPTPTIPNYTSSCCFNGTPVRVSVYSKEETNDVERSEEATPDDTHVLDKIPETLGKVLNAKENAIQVFDQIFETIFSTLNEKMINYQMFDEIPVKTLNSLTVQSEMQTVDEFPVKLLVDDIMESSDLQIFKKMTVKKILSGLQIATSDVSEEDQKSTLEGGSETTYELAQFEMDDAFEKNESQCNKGMIPCSYIHDEVVVNLFDPCGYSVGLGKLILLALSNFKGVLAEISDTHFNFLREMEMSRSDDIHKSDRIAKNLSIMTANFKYISGIGKMYISGIGNFFIIGVEHVNANFFKVLHVMRIIRPDTENEFLTSFVYNPQSELLHDFDLVLFKGAILCLIDSPESSVYVFVPISLEGNSYVSLNGAEIVLAQVLDNRILRRDYILRRLVGSLYWRVHTSKSSANHYETDAIYMLLFMGMLYKWLCFEENKMEVDIHGNILEYLNKSKNNVVKRGLDILDSGNEIKEK